MANSTTLHNMEALVNGADGALRTLLEYIVNNPTTVALTVLSVLSCLPGLVYIPILRLIGFRAGGILAGTLAAKLHALQAPLAAAGAISTSLSAAMGGYGVAIFNLLVRVAAVIGWIVTYLWNRRA